MIYSIDVENFSQTLLNDPENASICKKKCGIDIDKDKVREEERREVKAQANGADY